MTCCETLYLNFIKNDARKRKYVLSDFIECKLSKTFPRVNILTHYSFINILELMVSWLGVKGGNVHYFEKTHCCIKAITTWVKYVNLCRFEPLLQPDLTECQWCNSLTGFEYHVSLERERKLTHGHFIKLLLAPANKCLCFTQHPKSFWNCGCSSQRPRVSGQRCVLAHILKWGTGNGIQKEKKYELAHPFRQPADTKTQTP